MKNIGTRHVFSSSNTPTRDLASLYQESLIVMNSFAMAAHVLQSRGIQSFFKINQIIVPPNHVGNTHLILSKRTGRRKVCLLSSRSLLLPSVCRIPCFIVSAFQGHSPPPPPVCCNLSIRLYCTQEGRKWRRSPTITLLM